MFLCITQFCGARIFAEQAVLRREQLRSGAVTKRSGYEAERLRSRAVTKPSSYEAEQLRSRAVLTRATKQLEE